MADLDTIVEALAAKVAEAETLLRALGEENERLRAALVSPVAHGDAAGAGPGDGRPMRLALLEAEREQVRQRLRGLLEAL